MIDMMPPQGLLATGVVGGAQVLGPYPFVLAGNGFVGGANRPYGALVQFYDGVAVQGFTNAGADSNPIFAVGTNDGTIYFDVYNGGRAVTAHNTLDDGSGNVRVAGAVAAGSTIQAGDVSTPYAEMGLNIVGTIPSQIVTWWDNSQTYGAGLVENNNQVGLLLVNKAGSAYNGLNANSYTVPLFAAPTGAVYTQAIMNTPIGSNAGWTARNTLDDGSGNMDVNGHLTVGGSLSAAQGTFTPPAGSSGGDISQFATLIINGNFNGATTSQNNLSMIGWNYTSGGGEVDIIANAAGGGGALNIYKLTGSAAPYTPQLAVAINTEAMSVGVGAVPNNSTGLIYSTVVQGEYFQFDSTTGVTFDLPYPRPSPLPSGWGYTVQVTQQFSGGTMYFVSAKSSNSSITAYDSTTNTLYGWMVDIWQMQ